MTQREPSSDATTRIRLELRGSEAVRGITLAGFEAFTEHFRRALVDFDRSRRAEQTKRSGHPTSREGQLFAFRVVGLKVGSAILSVEPIAPEEETPQEALAAELLAVANLRALLAAVDDVAAEIDPDVTESLSAARRALGADGSIVVAVESPAMLGQAQRVVINEERVGELEARRPRRRRTATRIRGWLHMVDVQEPPRVGIRTASGVEWFCRYEEEIEPVVLGLLKRNVWATGHGVRTSSRRGEFTIEEIEAIDEYIQTELFERERRPLSEIRAEQQVGGPQGWDVLADPEWDDDDDASQRFLDTILGAESQT